MPTLFRLFALDSKLSWFWEWVSLFMVREAGCSLFRGLIGLLVSFLGYLHGLLRGIAA